MISARSSIPSRLAATGIRRASIAPHAGGSAPAVSAGAAPSSLESARDSARNLTRRLRDGLAEAVDEITVAPGPFIALEASDLAIACAKLAGAAARRPWRLVPPLRGLAGEIADVVAGRSSRGPAAKDGRFVDETWRDHPLYRRWMQAYLALAETARAIPDRLDVEPADRELGRFGLSLLVEAAAPTNALLGNPAALKRAFETAGASLWKGLQRAWIDLRENGARPSQVNSKPFVVGRTIAATPGAVVFRNPVLELLHYRPATPTVRERPVLFVPSQVNRYYVFDLAPGRSLIEHALADGQQVFAVSFRNPSAAERDWDLDTYARALLEAIDAVLEITGSADLNLVGACAGGVTSALLLSSLAAGGDRRVRSASFFVTMIDVSAATSLHAFTSPKLVERATARSRKRGIVSKETMFWAFTMLRPNEGLWSFWVNNYLLGNAPPASDVLFWANDQTNLAAGLHRQFLEVFARNAAARPGGMTVLGVPVDLSRIAIDVYAMAAEEDHLTPWKACFRTAQHFRGEVTFALSRRGHIMSLVHPPGGAPTDFLVRPDVAGEPSSWRERAQTVDGSWWNHWQAWLAARAGDHRPAPERLGSERHPVLEPAPGRYVRQA